MHIFDLPNGMQFVVDDEDAERVSLHDWIARAHSGFRPFARIKGNNGNPTPLHRFLMPHCKDAETIDHINGNVLDNRRCNLRPATHSQNCQHKRPNTPSSPRGIHRKETAEGAVYFGRAWNTYGAHVTPELTDLSEAQRAYDALVISLRGDFSYRHFPEGYEHLLPQHLIDAFMFTKQSPVRDPRDYPDEVKYFD